MDFLVGLLTSSATLGSIVGLVLAGVVYALLPLDFPRNEIAGGVFSLCFVVGLIYEFPFNDKKE